MIKIKSSEIASYLYCPRSWWIGITEGVKISEIMKKGTQQHNLISKNQSQAKFLYICILIVIMILIILITYKVLI